MKYDQNSHRYARKDELSPNLLFSNIKIDHSGDTIVNEFEQYEIDCNLHEKTLLQDNITLTVGYDIAIQEFTGEICMQPREKVETAST